MNSFGLSVDYYSLNKFASREDENYRKLILKLCEVTSAVAAEAICSYAVPIETVESYM